jgi:predicted Ser/Thr protein kinase
MGTPPAFDEDQPTLARRPSSAGSEPRFAPGVLLAGRYRVIYPLGRGGMGEVYRAEDLKLGQTVALKFVRGDLPAASRQRLYEEVRLGRQVSHPNVCRLYDIVDFDGLTFIAMEYVDGEDLASLLARIGHLAPDKALDIARDLCAGLQAAHDRGVLHRDLKPANVMIDGKGRARLMDFGLAVEQQAAPEREPAGTALYMSPEQLGGGQITARSDLYSLGLILYEMAAGQRFFQLGTWEELRSQHRAGHGPRLLSLSGHADRGFGRLVAQCLEEEPRARPSSARALLTLLPGGDALEAAIAAGETPAPDVVAGSGAVGDLRPAAAWGALLALVVGLALTGWLAQRVGLIVATTPPKTPEVLVERAQGILQSLGQNAAPADWAASYEWDLRLLFHVLHHDRSPDRFDRLRSTPLSPLLFLYRQSPQALVPDNRDAHVYRDDPPANVPGMAEVVLGGQGRLRSYRVVPPRVEAGGPWPDPDWSSLFKEARLDPAGFQPVVPEWSAPVDSDRKAAWEGDCPGLPGTRLRLEAAAYHGRTVWFAVLPSGLAPGGQEGRPPMAIVVVFGLMVIALPLGGVLLARSNLRLGRVDRRGSRRVAFFVFVTYSLARLCRADHVASLGEFWILITVVAYPLAWAALVWIVYLALEPYARRFWPRILISWGRVLSGRWRDPMAGRDVLLGAAAGALAAGLPYLVLHASSWLGRPQGLTDGMFVWTDALTSWRTLGYRIFVEVYSSVQGGIRGLFLLVLLRILLRRNALAVGAWFLLETLSASGLGLMDLTPETGIVIVVTALELFVLLRLGLVGLCAMTLSFALAREMPLTPHPGLWWASRGYVACAVLLGLGVLAFQAALAGKPALGDWLER